MPLRTRRLVAQQEAGEEEQPSSSMNPSLRSFFPLEVVNLILRELNDPPSLAAVCLVSFGCLEEASGQLYRDVVIRSEKGLISFTCGVQLRPRSRIVSHLSLSQTRTLEIRSFSFRQTNLLPFFVEKRGVAFPPRLMIVTPIHLNLLTVRISHDQESHESLTSTEAFDSSFDFYLLFVLPHLSPTHILFDAGSPPEASHDHLYLYAYDWPATTLRAWKDLRSVSCRGWIPLSTNELRFVLRDAPQVRDGEAFELEINVESWRDERSQGLVKDLQETGALGLEALRSTCVVSKSAEKGWEEEVAGLDEEEREDHDRSSLIVRRFELCCTINKQ